MLSARSLFLYGFIHERFEFATRQGDSLGIGGVCRNWTVGAD
jgi:hypothetical protein